jgi:exodeoxyribonuclease VIII
MVQHVNINMPNEDYQARPELSKSKLAIFYTSPEHYYDKYEAPQDDELDFALEQQVKKQTELGNAIHTAVLEPDEFENRYLAIPKLDRRKKEGKDAYADFLIQAKEEGKKLILMKDAHICYSIRERIRQHPIAQKIFSGSPLRETSFFWTDKETGLECKSRTDFIDLDAGIIVDVKSAISLQDHKFERSVDEFKYHFAPAFYGGGIYDLFGIDISGFIYLGTEKERPFGIKMFTLDDVSLAAGNDQVRKLMRRFAECREKKEWPGYPPEVRLIGLPTYALVRDGFKTFKGD